MSNTTLPTSELLRIQLDDQLFLHGQVDLLARRHRDDAPGDARRVEREPLWNPAALHFFHRVLERRVLLRAAEHGDHVACFMEYDGISTFLPFTRKCPWRTSCRACGRDVARPRRYTTLSSRRSSSCSSVSPVMPRVRSAASK